jgi:AraC family transcriptional regulator
MTHDYRIRRALAYIDNDSERNLSLAALAGIAAMSPFHFHRRFVAQTGTAVSAYVRRKRLERAAYDLLYTARPVEAIAAARGYHSAAAFSRSFHRTIGIAPTHLRSASPPFRATGAVARPKLARFMLEPPRVVRFIEERGRIVEATGKAWHAFARTALSQDETGAIGMCPDYPGITDPQHVRYHAGAPLDVAPAQHSTAVTRLLPGGWYAHFVHHGRLNDMRHVNEMWADIYRHWPMDNAWELRTHGAYEFYPTPYGQASTGCGAVVLHVPVILKSSRT